MLYNPPLQEVFEKAGLIRSNARGGCFATEKLRKNREKLVEAFYRKMPEARLTAGKRDG